MATNDRNAQNDRNRDDQNRNENLKGQSGNTSSASSQGSGWEKNPQEHGHSGMGGKQAPKTTNPSASQGYEANRNRNKYDEQDQDTQNKGKSDSTGRSSGI